MSKGLFKNAAYFTISSIIVKIVAFLYFGFIAKLLSPDQVGQYFLVLAIIGMLQVFNDVGTSPWLIRDIAGGQNKNEGIGQIVSIKSFTIPLTAIAGVIIPKILGYSMEVQQLILIGTIIIVADAISQTNFGILRGMKKLQYESIGIVIGQLISTGSGIAMLLLWQQIPAVLMIALGAGSTWNAIYGTYEVVRHKGWRVYIPKSKGIKMVLAASSAFFIANIFTRTFSYADTFIISKLMGEFELGVYSIAYKLTYAFQFIPLALIAALYPAFSSAQKKDEESLELLEGSFKYLALIAFPVVFGIFAIAEPLIELYASPEYIGAVLPLRIMIFALIFTFLDYPIGALLNARMKQNTKTAIMGATLVLNVILNIILIQWIGLIGAAITALISFAFMFTLGWIAARKIIPLQVSLLIKSAGIPLLASAVMAAMIMLAQIPIMAAIPAGAIVYATIILASRYMTLSEIRYGITGK